jgi:dienelactone hydrolase
LAVVRNEADKNPFERAMWRRLLLAPGLHLCVFVVCAKCMVFRGDSSVDQRVKETGIERPVRIRVGPAVVKGNLTIPSGAKGVVVFAHGSGSSRHSPRYRYVSEVLVEAGLATLLMDLLTREEETVDQYTAHLRFDIGLLAERLVGAADWLSQQSETASLPIGYFGASTGAGATLVAAAQRPDAIGAIVSRGGRPDLAGSLRRT